MGKKNKKRSEVPKLPSKLELLETCQNHHAFMQAVKFNQHLFHPQVINYAVFRYQNFWFPFAARHTDKELVAPLDLELVWMAHMLDHEAYVKDCLSIGAQKIIPHYHVSQQNRKNRYEETKALWEMKYSDEVPLVINHKRYPEVLMDYEPVVSIDLAQAIMKYRDLIHQISLPHYKDPKFLITSIYNYIAVSVSNYKNKGNKKKNTNSSNDIQNPAYDMVSMTHMTVPNAYHLDIENLKKIKRKNSKFLRKSAAKEGHIVGSEFEVARGSMSRGKTIPLYQSADERKLLTSANKVLTFEIVAYQVFHLLPDRSYKLKLRSKSLLCKTEKILQVLRIDESGFSDNIARDEAIFQYDSSLADVLQIRVSEIKMTNSSASLGSNASEREKFDFDYDLFNCEGFMDGEEITLKLGITQRGNSESETERESWIRLRCHVIEKGAINLFFGLKQPIEVSHAGHVCKVLAHPHLMAPHLTRKPVQPCLYVTKTLKNRRNETLYKCRVTKTEDGAFFSVEVLNLCDKLVCCSYTVGHEVLPVEEQVLDPTTCCMLRESGEAVFVIRSTNYEWGLLKVFPTMNEKENAVIPKKLIFMNMRDVVLKWVCLYDDNEKRTNIIEYTSNGQQQLSVDISFGRISLPTALQEYPELLSLGVTILAAFRCFPYKETLEHPYGRRVSAS